MKKDWLLFKLLVLGSLILSSIFLYIIVKYTYIATDVTVEDDKVYVDWSEQSTWGSINLDKGDRIISINGEDPLKHKLVAEWNQLEQVKEMKVEKSNGEIIDFEVKDEVNIEFIFHIAIPVFLYLLSIFCSYFIFKGYLKSNKRNKSSIILILFLFCLSLAYVCSGASARGELSAKILILALTLLTPIFYIHYLYLYFKELKTKWFSFKWIIFMYSFPIIVTLIYLYTEIFGVNTTGFSRSTLSSITLAMFASIIIIIAILIIRGYKVVSFKSQKYLIKILLIANSLAILPFVVLYIFPFLLFGTSVLPPVILAGFLIIIPLSLLYQYLAKKIYDIEFLLGRLRYYALVITIPSIICVVCVLVLKDSSHPAIETIRLYILIATVMFITLYLKEVFDFRFNLKRISEKNNYQESLLTYTQKIRVAKNLQEVTIILKDLILKMLLIERVVYLEVERKKTENKIFVINEEDKEFDYNNYAKLINKVCKNLGEIVEIEKGFILNIGEAEGKVIILVALSALNTPKLTRDEIEWLKALSYYTNVTLENFVKIEYLMENLEEIENKPNWLNKIVFNVEEKQRSELAKDLHDAVLQDLLSINKQLEIVADNSRKQNELDVVGDIQSIIDNMKSAIVTTRETCHQLRPQLLYDLGLEKALKKLVNKHNENGLRVILNTANLDDNIPKDIEINIYRIAQELLNNAKKHSNADDIRLLIVRIKEKIVINYEDNGTGADQDKILKKEESMGLNSIKERVNILKGTFKLETEINKGFKVTIEI